MRPEGTIYQRGKTPKKGEVILVLPAVVKIAFNLIRGVGAGIVGVVVMLFIFLYGPIIKQEVRYTKENITGENRAAQELLIKQSKADEIDKIQQEAEGHGVGTHFSVVIPKIGAASDVVANVDPWDVQEYEQVLQDNVAHAKGTYFPGQGSNIYLYSHSTDTEANIARFNAVFYLLRKLESGDKIIIFFSDKKYIYEVEKKVIVSPESIEWITQRSDDEVLILQTCDPPGTTWNRLLVIAKPVKTN